MLLFSRKELFYMKGSLKQGWQSTRVKCQDSWRGFPSSLNWAALKMETRVFCASAGWQRNYLATKTKIFNWIELRICTRITWFFRLFSHSFPRSDFHNGENRGEGSFVLFHSFYFHVVVISSSEESQINPSINRIKTRALTAFSLAVNGFFIKAVFAFSIRPHFSVDAASKKGTCLNKGFFKRFFLERFFQISKPQLCWFCIFNSMF